MNLLIHICSPAIHNSRHVVMNRDQPCYIVNAGFQSDGVKLSTPCRSLVPKGTLYS